MTMDRGQALLAAITTATGLADAKLDSFDAKSPDEFYVFYAPLTDCSVHMDGESILREWKSLWQKIGKPAPPILMLCGLQLYKSSNLNMFEQVVPQPRKLDIICTNPKDPGWSAGLLIQEILNARDEMAQQGIESGKFHLYYSSGWIEYTFMRYYAGSVYTEEQLNTGDYRAVKANPMSLWERMSAINGINRMSVNLELEDWNMRIVEIPT